MEMALEVGLEMRFERRLGLEIEFWKWVLPGNGLGSELRNYTKLLWK